MAGWDNANHFPRGDPINLITGMYVVLFGEPLRYRDLELRRDLSHRFGFVLTIARIDSLSSELLKSNSYDASLRSWIALAPVA